MLIHFKILLTAITFPILFIFSINIILNIFFKPNYTTKRIPKYSLQSLYLFLISWLFLDSIIRTETNLSFYISIFFAISIFIINLVSYDDFSSVITQFIYKLTGVLMMLFCVVIPLGLYGIHSGQRIYGWFVGAVLFREVVYVVSLSFFIYEGYNLMIFTKDEIHNFVYDKTLDYNNYSIPKIDKPNNNWIILPISSCILTIITPYIFNIKANLTGIYFQRRLPSKIIKIIINSHDYNITDEFIINLLIIGVLIYISMLYCLKNICYWLQELEKHANSTTSILICNMFIILLSWYFESTTIQTSALIIVH